MAVASAIAVAGGAIVKSGVGVPPPESEARRPCPNRLNPPTHSSSSRQAQPAPPSSSMPSRFVCAGGGCEKGGGVPGPDEGLPLGGIEGGGIPAPEGTDGGTVKDAGTDACPIPAAGAAIPGSVEGGRNVGRGADGAAGSAASTPDGVGAGSSPPGCVDGAPAPGISAGSDAGRSHDGSADDGSEGVVMTILS